MAAPAQRGLRQAGALLVVPIVAPAASVVAPTVAPVAPITNLLGLHH